jgi:hypothetical protein
MQKNKRKNSLFYLLIVALLLNSCSLEQRLEGKQRRAERRIEKLTIKYPNLLKKDTLYDTISIVTSEVRHDTQFVSQPGDTTYINNGKLEIKYVRIGDTTYIEGKCKSDTIIQTLEIPVERIVVRKESLIDQIVRYFKRSIIWVIILLAIAIAAGIAWKIAWKFIKPF